MAEKKELATLADNIVSSVTKKVDNLTKLGMKFAPDFNPTNALRASMLLLQDAKDKNGALVLESCSAGSIARALFSMLTRSLDASKGQVYFIPYGNNLTMIESYFGSVTRAKRAVPDFTPIVKLIHEGDVFEIFNDVETNETKVSKHETKFENLDKPIIGAYITIVYSNGKKDLLVMTMGEIQRSWAQSSNGGVVSKKFPIEMVKRTVLRKACKMIINTDISNASPIDSLEEELDINDSSMHPSKQIAPDYVDYEEVVEEEKVPSPEPEVKDKADMPKEAVAEQPSPKANAKTETEDQPF